MSAAFEPAETVPPSAGMIETIYASAVLSRSIDAIVADLEAEVLHLAQTGQALEAGLDLISPRSTPVASGRPDIARHVDLALQIQTQVGFPPPTRDWLGELLDRIPAPALAFDAGGLILRRNAAAARSAWADARDLRGLPGASAAILEASQALPPEDLVSAAPVRVRMPDGAAGCVLVKRAGAYAAERWGREVWILMLADLAIDDALASQARAVFGLSGAEAAVAVRFVQGKGLEAIATERKVSLETVRAQVKSIKSKTGARDMPALVRQLCALATGVFAGGEAAPAIAGGDENAPWSGEVRLPDGRRLQYLRQGANAGAPVVLLHNLGYGAQLPAAAHAAAAEAGLTVFAPLRAGHGHSDPAPAVDASALLDQAADDLAAMMDGLGLSSARLLGNVAGASYAVRFASRYPERVHALVLLNRGPVWRDAWLRDLSPNHRALAVIHRHFPSAGRLVVGAILHHFHRHGAADYAAKGALESPPDLLALQSPETLNLIGHGVTFGLRQGPEAYCRDFEAMQIDLSAEIRALPHPIMLIHGRHDRIVPPIFAQRFAEAAPNARLIELEDAGHFLLYSHWRAVLEALIDAV